jgi:hypothetical protein
VWRDEAECAGRCVFCCCAAVRSYVVWRVGAAGVLHVLRKNVLVPQRKHVCCCWACVGCDLKCVHRLVAGRCNGQLGKLCTARLLWFGPWREHWQCRGIGWGVSAAVWFCWHVSAQRSGDCTHCIACVAVHVGMDDSMGLNQVACCKSTGCITAVWCTCKQMLYLVWALRPSRCTSCLCSCTLI